MVMAQARKRMSYFKKRAQNNSGGILVLLALTLPVILLMASGAYMILSYASATEQIEAAAKMSLLAAAEEYFATSCSLTEGGPGQGESERDACHIYKLNAALTRANEVSDQNSQALGGIVIGSEETNSSGARGDSFDFDAEIRSQHYFHEIPQADAPNSDAIITSCENAMGGSGEAAFPCLLQREEANNEEIANAFTISGTVRKNRVLNALSNLFGFKLASGHKSFFLKVRAIPMRMCVLVDISSSVAYTTHPENENPLHLPSYPLDDDGQILTEMRGAPFTEFETSWDSLDYPRGINVPNSYPITRYKDDYGLVETYDDSLTEFEMFQSDYPQYAENHTPPLGEVNELLEDDGSSSGTYSYTGTSERESHLVDLYRHTAAAGDGTITYNGPEPWVSIFEGVHRASEIFKDRAVAGDKVCLILYNDRLSWKSVINLTDNFDYVRKVLDPEQIRDPDNLSEVDTYSGSMPIAANSGTWDKTSMCDVESDGCMPLWARLGLFPMAGTFTNTGVAISEALRQFENDEMGTPSVDFIAHFGDGLTSCFNKDDGSGLSCDSASHAHYLRSMHQIERMVSNGMRNNNVSFHNFLIGDHVAPHTILLQNPATDECYSDSEARKKMPPVDYVLGQGFNSKDMEHATAASQTAFLDTPFYQVNYDWYNLVRITGGVWAPLRPKAPGCTPEDPAPTCGSEPVRLETDPKCRNTADQVYDYLTEALESSSGFSIIQ